jgi:branched-chain amino acid aminotransferase
VRIWLGTRDSGAVVDPRDARVSVMDHGFTVADGVFETLKVTPEGAFAVSRHLLRLAASAQALGLAAPDPDVVRRAIDEVLAANAGELGPLGRLRITYTAGAAPLGSDRGDAVPTLVVAVAPTQPWPPTTTAVVVPWTRNERSAVAGVKSTSYADNVVALQHAHAAGASEGLFANTRDELCEGTGTNVFVVLDGAVMTPPLSSGCLAGITRELVLEWFGAREQVLPIEVLEEADEAFLTSSTRDVHPLVRVDDRRWDVAGAVSAELREAFAARAAQDIDP